MPTHCLRPAAFALLALASVPSLATAETEHVSRTVSVGPGGALHLNSFSGKVTVTGSDRQDVTIDAVRRGTRDQLDRIKLDIQSDASTVRIEANRKSRSWFYWGGNNVVETDFEITVPRRTNLSVTLFSASLHIRGVEGSHDIRTFSSDTRLDDVSGSIHARSFSGSIEIRTSAWLDRQTISAETFSGGVRLHVPDSAQGSVEFESFSGRLNTALPLTFRSSSRRHFSGQLGQGSSGHRGTVRVKTFSGDVSLDR